MEIKNMSVFTGILLIGFLMFGLVSGAGYNLVVPDTDSPADPVSPGGGGSTSGGGSSLTGLTYSVSTEQFIVGYSKEISLNDRLRISINDELHHVKLVGVTATTISINVSSETQQATLTIGEVKRFDVDVDGNYDLSVKLNSINITSSKADLTITSISGEVAEDIIEEEIEENVVADEQPVDIADEFKGKSWVWFMGALVIVAGVVAIYLKRKKKK